MGEHVKAPTGPIEKKVSMATLGAFASSAVVATLNAWVGDNSLMGSLPGWLQTIAIGLGPTAVTFVSGYYAKHTPRSAE